MNAKAKTGKDSGDSKKKTPMSNKKYLTIWIPVIALVATIAVVANIALSVAEGWVASQYGAGTYEFTNSEESEGLDSEYYTADYASLDEVDEAAKQLVEEIGAGGIVLAKNEGESLPLAQGAQITMFGAAVTDPVFGGSGSGSVDTNSAITPRVAMENAGFGVNDAVFNAIAAHTDETARGYIEMDDPENSTYNIGELPVADYEAQSSSFGQYNDAAVIMIGRPGGEGGDLTMDMAANAVEGEPVVDGQHQLELDQNELDMIELAKANFETVVIVINASTTMELGNIHSDAGVDAILLAGSPGSTAFNALGRILNGEVNPSGRTVDTWAADFTADPTFANFGDFVYNNIEAEYPVSAVESATSNATVTTDAPFINLAEGIYFGYRYYETAAAEGFIDYDEAVVYPFGYGLSYTDFSWRVTDTQSGAEDGTIAMTVEVTNNGTVAGRDVVEVFYSAPYTPGGIEKSAVILAGFAKTGEIAPGASESVTVEFAVEDMASYDYLDAAAYVLEAGDYEITARLNSHTVADGTEPLVYTVDSDIVYSGDNHRSSDVAEVTNQFDDVSAEFSSDGAEGTIQAMSRADFAGTFPAAPTPDLFEADQAIIDGFAAWDPEATAEEMPTTGASTDLALIDMRGLPRDDPQWEDLLDSLSVNDMTSMLLNGAYQTAAIGSIAKPPTVEPDGPAGFSSFINPDIKGVAYPSQVLIAQTWDVDLGYAMGETMGNEALFKGINGWYAPAVNLHRSPFAGRNFEYYSEDPLLSGNMLTAVANGVGTKGVYTLVKHFALNEQETNRVNNGPATWGTEQVIREVYLRPFEIAVKGVTMEVPYIADENGTIETATVGLGGIMSSFNRIGATWAGGSQALMTDVLRNEWGFEGFAISDFNLYPYMNPNQGIHAGTDLTLTFQPSKSFGDTTSASAVNDIRNATHNILYVVANSNAMNGQAPGVTVSYTPPTWKYIQWVSTAVVGLLLLGALVMVVLRVRRHSGKGKQAAEASA
ncbi:MAG: glycoside hydrolase family 3 C-terminal domain-containing protein [Beutenbergiaceae bacterium]